MPAPAKKFVDPYADLPKRYVFSIEWHVQSKEVGLGASGAGTHVKV